MVLPSNSVFISYRKDESAGWSVKLADDLRAVLGDAAVFIDDSTGIPYGTQWPDQISVALDQCRVFLPVIAPSWHQATNLNRLKEPNDWVRQELITTHGRRSSVLCIPVFVNEAHIITADQFAGDPELQKAIADLMTDQGIKLDRSTEYWPAKIASLILRIETHLGINIPQPDDTFTANDTDQPDSSTPPRSPVTQWLHGNSTWLGAVGAIAAVIALYPVFFGSQEPSVSTTFQVEGTNYGDQVAGDKITTNIGYTQTQYEEGLRRRENDLQQEYDVLLAPSDNRAEAQIEKRVIIERELAVIHDKLSNIEAAYLEIKADLTSALKTNEELEGQIPAKQLEAAEKAIELGPEAAYEAYNAIVETVGEPIAKAAFQAAELAESAIRYPEALKHYRKAAVLDDQNPLYLNNLAIMYELMGRYADAEPLFVESLAILKKQLGDEHPNVATSLNNLAGLYRSQGRYADAEPLYVESLAIRKMQLGDEHPNTVVVKRNYKRYLSEVDQYQATSSVR